MPKSCGEMLEDLLNDLAELDPLALRGVMLKRFDLPTDPPADLIIGADGKMSVLGLVNTLLGRVDGENYVALDLDDSGDVVGARGVAK